MTESTQPEITPADRSAKGAMTVTVVGMAANVALSGAKVGLGLVFRSGALVADGVHSGGDLASDVAVVAGLSASRRQADRCHPYGHRRIQTLTALFIGALVVTSAAFVGLAAVRKWLAGDTVAYGWGPFVAAMVSVVTKETLFRGTRRVGRRTGDTAVLANAWHHRSDALSSVAAGLGMLGVAIGGMEWAFLDHVTAIALAGILVAMGLRIGLHAAQELVDRAPAKATMERIGAIVARTAGVRTYHAFRMRQSGGMLEMDVHIQVDPTLTVAEGHDIASEVRERIVSADPKVTSVIVHVEPVEDG